MAFNSHSQEKSSVGRYLKRFTESHGRAKTAEMFSDALAAGKINKNQLSIRELAESMIGPDWGTKLHNRYYARGTALREATEAVDSSAFVDITGQLLVQEIKAKYEAAPMVASKLVDEEQITNGNLGTQRVPWLSVIAQEPQQIQQGKEYPHATFSEQYIDYPAPEKWGQICAITFEMIFSDLTKQVFESAGSVGLRMAQNKEERILANVLGIVNTHSWNGTTYNTYLTSGSWVNSITGKVIQDWTDLNDLEQLFANMLDPVSGRPIEITPNGALIMPYRWYNWKRLKEATNTKTGAYSTTGYTPQMESPSPLDYNYAVYQSKLAYQLLTNATGNAYPTTGLALTAAQAREYVFLGDFKRAFVYRYVYPLQTVEAPPMSTPEFQQDITFQVKASEFGVCCTRDPRYVLKSVNN